MPCSCGDPYCWSCGPPQGNVKCPVCGVWSADGGCRDPVACDRALAIRAEDETEEAAMLDARYEMAAEERVTRETEEGS